MGIVRFFDKMLLQAEKDIADARQKGRVDFSLVHDLMHRLYSGGDGPTEGTSRELALMLRSLRVSEYLRILHEAVVSLERECHSCGYQAEASVSSYMKAAVPSGTATAIENVEIGQIRESSKQGAANYASGVLYLAALLQGLAWAIERPGCYPGPVY
jgi:hypothetical protein